MDDIERFAVAGMTPRQQNILNAFSFEEKDYWLHAFSRNSTIYAFKSRSLMNVSTVYDNDVPIYYVHFITNCEKIEVRLDFMALSNYLLEDAFANRVSSIYIQKPVQKPANYNEMDAWFLLNFKPFAGLFWVREVNPKYHESRPFVELISSPLDNFNTLPPDAPLSTFSKDIPSISISQFREALKTTVPYSRSFPFYKNNSYVYHMYFGNIRVTLNVHNKALELQVLLIPALVRVVYDYYYEVRDNLYINYVFKYCKTYVIARKDFECPLAKIAINCFLAYRSHTTHLHKLDENQLLLTLFRTSSSEIVQPWHAVWQAALRRDLKTQGVASKALQDFLTMHKYDNAIEIIKTDACYKPEDVNVKWDYWIDSGCCVNHPLDFEVIKRDQRALVASGDKGFLNFTYTSTLIDNNILITCLAVSTKLINKAMVVGALLHELDGYAKKYIPKVNYLYALPVPARLKTFDNYGYNWVRKGEATQIMKSFGLVMPSHFLEWSSSTKAILENARQWTTTAYFLFNRALRRGDRLNEQQQNIYNAMIAYFDMQGFVSPEYNLHDLNMTSLVVFRGLHVADKKAVDADIYSELFGNSRVKILHDKGFMAFSKDRSVSAYFARWAPNSRGILLVFDLLEFPHGTRLIDMEPISTADEKELLAMSGSIELIKLLDSTNQFDMWQAKYTPYHIEKATVSNKQVILSPVSKSNSPISKSHLSPWSKQWPKSASVFSSDTSMSAGKGGLNFTDLLANQPDSKLLVVGKIAIFYVLNRNECQVLRVLKIHRDINITDHLTELDASHSDGVNIAIVNPSTREVEAWRYGDMNPLPTKYHKALRAAMNKHGIVNK